MQLVFFNSAHADLFANGASITTVVQKLDFCITVAMELIRAVFVAVCNEIFLLAAGIDIRNFLKQSHLQREPTSKELSDVEKIRLG